MKNEKLYAGIVIAVWLLLAMTCEGIANWIFA